MMLTRRGAATMGRMASLADVLSVCAVEENVREVHKKKHPLESISK